MSGILDSNVDSLKTLLLGVGRIVPFRADRSNETGRGRNCRWQRIGEAGFTPVHFGNRILRAETAAILAVGLIACEPGVL